MPTVFSYYMYKVTSLLMSASQNHPATLSRSSLCTWFQTPLGRRLQHLEIKFLRATIKVPYSFTLIQLGILGWERRYLDSGYLRRFSIIDELNPPRTELSTIIAHPDALPLRSESIDMLILPHTLEFSSDQHQLLREAERVLKPEGQLLILGFQPWSFYRLYRWLPNGQHSAPWRSRAVGHHRLLDWLNLLNFSGELAAWFDFHTIHYPSIHDWWRGCTSPLWSVAYAISAIKRTYTIIPIKPILQATPRWTPGLVEPSARRNDHDR